MSPYDAWKTFDTDREDAEARAEAFDEEMSWPPETDAPENEEGEQS